ncbi:MAG: pyridoxal phosphate-dependent aminotransferase [Alphaproteobacteria bacterium]|nr:pyridoxal phosphate-dependent aminotransferase [Alphaproteobacteria bacterium]
MKFRHIVENLSSNPGAEIVRYGRRKAGVLSLGQGEGDIATPDFIMRAAEEAMRQGKTFYGPVLGHEELRQEIATYYARLHHVDLPSHRVFVTGSGTTAMHLALTALLDEDEEAVAVTPIWKNLVGAVELAEARVREVPLRYQEGVWHLDMQQLFDSCTPQTRVILVTSPSNPAGWVMTREEMRTLLEFTRARGIWILSDEVYARTTYELVHAPSFLEVAEPDDLLFVVNSFSKNWAMTGWRLGWLVGPAAAEAAIRDIAIYDNMGPPSFTQFGGLAALRHGEDFIEQQRQLWRANRDLVHETFRASNRIEAEKPAATFYSFFKVEGEPDCLALARRLIDEVSLSMAPGCAFGKVGQGYMRMCFAVSRPKLEDALDRLQTALKR